METGYMRITSIVFSRGWLVRESCRDENRGRREGALSRPRRRERARQARPGPPRVPRPVLPRPARRDRPPGARLPRGRPAAARRVYGPGACRVEDGLGEPRAAPPVARNPRVAGGRGGAVARQARRAAAPRDRREVEGARDADAAGLGAGLRARLSGVARPG